MRLFLLTLSSLVFALAACGRTPEPVASPTPEAGADPAPPAAAVPATGADAAPSDASPAPAGAQPGQRPPSFDLENLRAAGERVRLAELQGKVVLVTFWASWCGPCRMEIPALEKPYRELRDAGLEIVGVSIDDDEAAARSFLSMFPVTYPMVLDVGGRNVGDAWGVSSIPATVLLGKDGLVRKRHLGYAPTMLANTVTEIRALLEE